MYCFSCKKSYRKNCQAQALAWPVSTGRSSCMNTCLYVSYMTCIWLYFRLHNQPPGSPDAVSGSRQLLAVVRSNRITNTLHRWAHVVAAMPRFALQSNSLSVTLIIPPVVCLNRQHPDTHTLFQQHRQRSKLRGEETPLAGQVPASRPTPGPQRLGPRHPAACVHGLPAGEVHHGEWAGKWEPRCAVRKSLPTVNNREPPG